MTNQQGPLGIFHRTFVEPGYKQNKLECSKEAVISLKLWVPEKSLWELRTCFFNIQVYFRIVKDADRNINFLF